MALFKYQAKNTEGVIYDRTAEAADRIALYKIIRDEGGTVVSIKEAKTLKSFNISFGPLFAKVKTQDKITFAKNLSSMIDAGLSVTRALDVMSKQSKSKAMQKMMVDLGNDVSHGLPLSEALGKHKDVFSELFVSMVKAGEESGSISQSLRIVGLQMEKNYLLVKKVRGAMIYPAVIIAVMLIIAVLLLIFMVPTLTATFEGLGVKLPLPTRILIASSDFMVENTLVVLSAMVGFVVAAIMFFRSKTGRSIIDSASLRIPVIGEMVREVQAARSARTLSSLLSSGVEIVSALGVTAEVLQNHLYKEVLLEAQSGIQKGEQMSVVFSRHALLYPAFVDEMTAVGEETGKIAEMLKGVADFYEEQVDQKTKDLSTIIEPILMIFIGLGVGVFAISMLAPTYSLVDYI